MRLPTQKKILREDLKDAPAYVNGIIEPVNTFMEAVYQSLNKNITLQDNIACFIKELIYITPAAYPVIVDQVKFKNELKTKPIGLIVLQAYEKSTYVPADGPVYAPWVEDKGSIVLSTITGLVVSKTYIVRLLIF